ncbi:MAG: bifunctional cystathionine gamma-lyase/homocysteine desulfhydrase [Acidobacteriaceae bacterium]
MSKTEAGFNTRAIHAGNDPEPMTGAVNVPIFLTSTYAQEEIGKHKGYEYSRVNNPTRDALEENLRSLEGGTSAHVFASGMASIHALCMMLRSGDHVVCGHNVYGGTPRLFDSIIAHYGIAFTYVDASDLGALEGAIKPNTKLVHIETPTNPLMVIVDLRGAAEVCHKRGVELSVDNTFLSPYFQRPIEFGADIVMHSTTKFLNGHSDGLGGVLVGTKPEHKEKFSYIQKAAGGILSPFECYLVLRGVKTLGVRMDRHDQSGRKIAEYLSQHNKVQKVIYPGLPQHPQFELAKRQQSGFGAMITFETGSIENANKMLRKLRVCTVGESLGGVETLISHPATMTHAAVGEEGRRKIGLTDGMVRISVGLEDVEDLLADLDQGLAAI